MSRYDVYFNEVNISYYCDVELDIERRLPEWEPTLVSVPASNVAIFGGTHALPLEIGMTLITADGFDRGARQNLIRDLSRILAVTEPKRLKLGDEHGLYRMALPKGEIEITQHLNADEVHVTFVCPDPRLFGDNESVSIGTSLVSHYVFGTASPSSVVVRATATPNSSGIWRIEDQTTGEHMELTGLSTGTSHSVIIDCSARNVSVDGVVRMLSIASDWFTLSPTGTHKLRITVGSGTATLEYQEMWW